MMRGFYLLKARPDKIYLFEEVMKDEI